MFKSFPHSDFEIVGPDGLVRSKTSAIFTGDTIVVPDASVTVMQGDEMRRRLPNGTDEVFEVVDPRFYEETFGIEPHYQVKVRRKGAFPAGQGGNFSISVTGSNARVNVGSVDNSQNVVGDSTVFNDLKAAISSQISDAELQAKLRAAVQDMEAHRGSGLFAEAYQKFIGLAADHIAVFGPMLPALASYLVK